MVAVDTPVGNDNDDEGIEILGDGKVWLFERVRPAAAGATNGLHISSHLWYPSAGSICCCKGGGDVVVIVVVGGDADVDDMDNEGDDLNVRCKRRPRAHRRRRIVGVAAAATAVVGGLVSVVEVGVGVILDRGDDAKGERGDPEEDAAAAAFVTAISPLLFPRNAAKRFARRL